MRLEELQLDPELLHLLVFGPGYGESILVYSPPGAWLAVDSVRQQRPSTDINPALALLEMHGAALSAVVLTHPHEDHARGLTQLLERRLPESPVGCVPGFLKPPGESRSHPDAAMVLDDASARSALNRIDHIWRRETSSRWPLVTGSTQSLGHARIEVLAPPSVPPRLPRDLNRLSSPLLVEWRECRLVLGADLPRARWSAVSRLSVAPQVSANQGLKVAHHGSRGAQHPIAIGEPPPGERACVVTPFNKGRQLPRYEEGHGIDQLLAANRRVLVTAVGASARGKEVPRDAMSPKQEAFGALTLAYEQPAAVPEEAWITITLEPTGAVVSVRAGDAAGTVIA